MADDQVERGRRKAASIRRDEIIAIAADLFATKGYDGASLRDIADRAGLTKAALYYHFPDKEQIFEVVVMTRLDSLVADVQDAVDTAGDDPVDRIRAYLLRAAGRIDKDKSGWLASSNAFWSMQNTQNRERLVERRDRFERLLREQVEEGMRRGLLREGDPALVTRLMLSGLNQIPRWHKPKGPKSVAQIMEVYLNYILEGALVR